MNVVRLPDLKTQGEIVLFRWLKNDGEQVNPFDPLCEVEMDKAILEIHAESSGLLKILALDGSSLKEGEVIARIE